MSARPVTERNHQRTTTIYFILSNIMRNMIESSIVGFNSCDWQDCSEEFVSALNVISIH